MTLFQRLISYAVFAIQVVIVVVLIFESQAELPLWLQSVGRVHPLLLHLPIGLLVICTILSVLEKQFQEPKSLLTFLLYLTAFTASLSAFMGLLLSLEGVYSQDDLLFHKWFG